MEHILIFAPIVVAASFGAFTYIFLVLEGEFSVLIWISLAVFSFLSLAMAIVTISYLLGPDCIYCYEPKKFRIVAEYSIAVLIYGTIGLVLVLWNKRGLPGNRQAEPLSLKDE